MNYTESMLRMTLGEIRRIALAEQSATIKSEFLSFRGEASIKLNDATIYAKIMYSEFDAKNKRIVQFTDLRASDDGQRLVIDVYLDDLIAREWATGMGATLDPRSSENANHAMVLTTLH